MGLRGNISPNICRKIAVGYESRKNKKDLSIPYPYAKIRFMKKSIITLFVFCLSFSAFAQNSNLDDAISEKLAPLLNNYLGNYQIRFQATHTFQIKPGQTSSVPVFLSSVDTLNAEGLQDCEENKSSIVCLLASSVESFVKINAVKNGAITLDITLYQNSKFVKEIKNVEVLKFN